MENNIFGNPAAESKRSLNDAFVIKPFSVLNTMDAGWVRRKAWWNEMITNRGASRESVLFKKSSSEATKVGSVIQGFNKGVSLFDPVVSEAMLRWFSNEGYTVFDPFAGDETRGFVSCYLDRSYIGIELRQEQVDLNLNRIIAGVPDAKVRYICNTSELTLNYVEKRSVDFVFTCSPFLWLEKYSNDPRDLSNMSESQFFDSYTNILKQSYEVLKDNRFAALVVGEVRRKDGSYVGFVNRTIDIMVKAGFHYYNEMILMNNVGTLRFRVGNSMNASRKVGKQHQNVLIFYKGDTSEIGKTFPKLIGLEDE